MHTLKKLSAFVGKPLWVLRKKRLKGLHSTPGSRFLGVNWVVASADSRALASLVPLHETVRMKKGRNVEVSTAVCGSAAYMGAFNPYPGDIDFNEIVMVRARHIEEAACIFSQLLQSNIERLVSLPYVRYSELKLGADPNTGKGLKWSLDEVRRGVKEIESRDSRKSGSLTICEAALMRQMIKLDLVVQMDGIWREVTKVIRFVWRLKGSIDSPRIFLLSPENLSETIYQELYFNRREAKLAVLVSNVSEEGGFHNPMVREKYRRLMDVEIAHYGALGMAERVSHLKLLKRWFNKLRMDNDGESICSLACIFQSSVNELNELKERISLLGMCVRKGLLDGDEILEQLKKLSSVFRGRSEAWAAEGFDPTGIGLHRIGDLSEIAELVAGRKTRRAAEGLSSLAENIGRLVEEKARVYLLEQLLKPHAERLGVRMRTDDTSCCRNLFKEIESGDKMLYLVQRYLRHDSRVLLRSYKKGEVIIRAGDDAQSFFIILKGIAAVFGLQDEGIEASRIREVGPFSIIGEIALLHREGRRTASVLASSGVEALEVPEAVFSELMEDSSFRLFMKFLSTDRLMEDGARARWLARPHALLTSPKALLIERDGTRENHRIG